MGSAVSAAAAEGSIVGVDAEAAAAMMTSYSKKQEEQPRSLESPKVAEAAAPSPAPAEAGEEEKEEEEDPEARRRRKVDEGTALPAELTKSSGFGGLLNMANAAKELINLREKRDSQDSDDDSEDADLWWEGEPAPAHVDKEVKLSLVEKLAGRAFLERTRPRAEAVVIRKPRKRALSVAVKARKASMCELSNNPLLGFAQKQAKKKERRSSYDNANKGVIIDPAIFLKPKQTGKQTYEEIERFAPPEGSLASRLLEDAAKYEGDLDWDDFQDLLDKFSIFHGKKYKFFRKRLYSVFDRNEDKLVQFGEVAMAVDLFTNGTNQERLSFVFDVCDQDGSGNVVRSELSDFLKPAAETITQNIISALEWESQLAGCCSMTLETARLSTESHIEGKSTITFEEFDPKSADGQKKKQKAPKGQKPKGLTKAASKRGTRGTPSSSPGRSAGKKSMESSSSRGGITSSISSRARGSIDEESTKEKKPKTARAATMGRSSKTVSRSADSSPRAPASSRNLEQQELLQELRRREEELEAAVEDAFEEDDQVVEEEELDEIEEEDSPGQSRLAFTSSTSGIADIAPPDFPPREESAELGRSSSNSIKKKKEEEKAVLPRRSHRFSAPAVKNEVSDLAERSARGSFAPDTSPTIAASRLLANLDLDIDTRLDVPSIEMMTMMGGRTDHQRSAPVLPAADILERAARPSCDVGNGQRPGAIEDAAAAAAALFDRQPTVYVNVKNVLGVLSIHLEKNTLLAASNKKNARPHRAKIESNVLEALLDDCFKNNDSNGDGRLTIEEFVCWAGANETIETILRHLEL